MFSRTLLVLPAVAITLLAACDDQLFTADQGTEPVTGEGCDAVGSILSNECLACHSASGHAGGLDLETDWYGTVIARGFVIAGDSAGSKIYQRITNAASPMPPSGLLPTETTDVIAAWIDAGATCDGTTVDTDTEETPNGATLFSDGCTGCHGTDGNSGGYAPSLSNVVPGQDVADITDIVQHGEGSMPAIYTDFERASTVAAYVVATFGGDTN